MLYKSAAEGFRIDVSKFRLDALLAAVVILLISWLIEAGRLFIIIHGMTGSESSPKISYRKVLAINWATSFSGNITPFYSGGIPTQVYLLCKAGLTAGKSSAVVTLRVILSSLVFTILTPFLLLFYNAGLTSGYMRNATSVAIPIAFALSGLLLLLMLRPGIVANLLTWLMRVFTKKRSPQNPPSRMENFLNKVYNQIEIFRDSIHSFRKGIGVYLAFLFSLLYWASFFAITPFLMWACGIDIKGMFWQIIFFQFVLVFIIAYIPIPSGSGIMELGFYSVFSFIPPPLRALFIFIWRILSYHVATFVGGVVLVRLINQPPARVRQPEGVPK
jgi:uncharacterized protein (TIRG00374 family)